jgi:hypothetical protein
LLGELERLFPHEKWAHAIYAHVVKIKESLETEGITALGLFGGISGICFAMRHISQNGERYQKMLASLDRYLIEKLEEELFPALEQHFEAKIPPAMRLYDLIQGITGIGVYASTSKQLFPILEKILHLLVQLRHPIEFKGKKVPGWFLSPEDPYLINQREKYPNGNINLGLAHGITGVLGFLSITALKGIEVPKQRETIEFLARWLQNQRKGIKHHYCWETVIPFEDYPTKTNPYTPSRDAWCYGTPGIARTLFIAGKVLGDQTLKDFALESYLSIFSRSEKEWNLPGPSICHGIAGLLLNTHFMYVDTKHAGLKEHRDQLRELLFTFYDEANPIGFKDLEPCTDGSFFPTDKLDLLEGAPGIFLTLLTIDNPNTGQWHLPLLLDE